MSSLDIIIPRFRLRFRQKMTNITIAEKLQSVNGFPGNGENYFLKGTGEILRGAKDDRRDDRIAAPSCGMARNNRKQGVGTGKMLENYREKTEDD